MKINLNDTVDFNIYSRGAAQKRNVSKEFSADLAAVSAPKLKLKTDFSAGRIGLDLNPNGVPARVSYFDNEGNKLTTSGFNADAILKFTSKFGIDISSLKDLAAQMDEANIGFRPYELYPGTGSDHGIDLVDLANGGLGTAYDWRKDTMIQHKGLNAEARLQEKQELASSLGVELNDNVTTEKGIDPSKFDPASTPQGKFGHVAWTNQVAVWFKTEAEAQQMAQKLYGNVKPL